MRLVSSGEHIRSSQIGIQGGPRIERVPYTWPDDGSTLALCVCCTGFTRENRQLETYYYNPDTRMWQSHIIERDGSSAVLYSWAQAEDLLNTAVSWINRTRPYMVA